MNVTLLQQFAGPLRIGVILAIALLSGIVWKLLADYRAQRRAGQLGLTEPEEVTALAEDLRRRDEYDSEREDSPLRPARDAVIVDSTHLDRAAVIDRVVALAASAVAVGERS